MNCTVNQIIKKINLRPGASPILLKQNWSNMSAFSIVPHSSIHTSLFSFVHIFRPVCWTYHKTTTKHRITKHLIDTRTRYNKKGETEHPCRPSIPYLQWKEITILYLVVISVIVVACAVDHYLHSFFGSLGCQTLY